jgi:phenylpyruvate tautomerase PptA (4-oxalocrotonate tautomerase family)
MTIITVTTPENRLSPQQRSELAESLTDAVLIPEVGQYAPPARVGFQVHFIERALDHMAIGGRLLSQQTPMPDVATIDICVMDAAWPKPARQQVIENVLAAMAKACGNTKPSPAWWVTFRIIDEGSWGSRGSVLSILDLLASGVFTSERVAEIRNALDGRSAPSET